MTQNSTFNPTTIQALVFDVFGTVVDWRSSVSKEVAAFCVAKDVDLDELQFADDWRAGYQPAMEPIRNGTRAWANIDTLHREVLERLLVQYDIVNVTESEKRTLNMAWHRLIPWPDAVTGLTRLRRKYIIATLSNGNMALLTNMAKLAGLPWDCILSAELARQYKPRAEVYRMAADLLGLAPEQVMMVAAHVGDLHAARDAGLRTGFVHRPLEFGEARQADRAQAGDFDVVAVDFIDLAKKL